jgi:hypothetical protein
MRWAAARSADPVLAGVAAYVRAETFFCNEPPAAGLRVLEAASAPLAADGSRDALAIYGSLHMRAAVLAASGGLPDAAASHLAEAASACTSPMPLTAELPSAHPACGYTRSRRLPRQGTARQCSVRPPGGSHRGRCPLSGVPTTSLNWPARSSGSAGATKPSHHCTPRAGSRLSTPDTAPASTRPSGLSSACAGTQVMTSSATPTGLE